jgi:hypothetical protein
MWSPCSLALQNATATGLIGDRSMEAVQQVASVLAKNIGSVLTLLWRVSDVAFSLLFPYVRLPSVGAEPCIRDVFL